MSNVAPLKTSLERFKSWRELAAAANRKSNSRTTLLSHFPHARSLEFWPPTDPPAPGAPPINKPKAPAPAPELDDGDESQDDDEDNESTNNSEAEEPPAEVAPVGPPAVDGEC